MKKILLILAINLITAIPVWADSATHERATEELLLAVGTDVVLEQSITEQLALQIQNEPYLKPYQNLMKAFLDKYMGWQTLKKDLIRLYTETFTESETLEILSFYQTPAGRKILKKQPELMAQVTQLGLKRVQDNLPELEVMVAAEAERLQKKE